MKIRTKVSLSLTWHPRRSKILSNLGSVLWSSFLLHRVLFRKKEENRLVINIKWWEIVLLKLIIRVNCHDKLKMPVISVNSCKENSMQSQKDSHESRRHEIKSPQHETSIPSVMEEESRVASPISSPNRSIRCRNDMLECAGCSQPIFDRFYLFADDQKWHISCLKCFACDNALESQVSCYTREGKIFCKQDYYK